MRVTTLLIAMGIGGLMAAGVLAAEAVALPDQIDRIETETSDDDTKPSMETLRIVRIESPYVCAHIDEIPYPTMDDLARIGVGLQTDYDLTIRESSQVVWYSMLRSCPEYTRIVLDYIKEEGQ